MSFLSQPISLFPVKPIRSIGGIDVNVVINENTTDMLTITKQPVQQGAPITDHAYKEPTVFTTSIYFTDNPTISLAKLYQQLLDLQNSRIPFDIVTPKRIYKTMLLQSLGQTTDKTTENTLAINASFQEVIIVNVTTVTVPKKNQKSPKVTAKTEDAGKKSIILKGAEAVKSLFGVPAALLP